MGADNLLSRDWLGIGIPQSISPFAAIQEQFAPALKTIGVFALDFVMFVVPGFAFANVIQRRNPAMNAVYLTVLVIVVSATLGYLSFWIFFFSKLLGKIYCFAIYAVSLISLVYASFHSNTPILTRRIWLLLPFSLSFLAGPLYICFSFLFTNPATFRAEYVGQRFFS